MWIYYYDYFLLLKFLKLGFYLVLMYVYLLLWYILYLKMLKIGFLFGVNACVFITMILFQC